MPTMAEIRAKAKARQKTFGKDRAVFPHWKMEFGASSIIRFVPYQDPNTGLCYTEQALIPMAFVDPADETKLLQYRAPCRTMYGHEKCPLTKIVSVLFNEAEDLKKSGMESDSEALRKVASQHWKDVSYYYQGFVNKSGIAEEELPENPIRIFRFNKQVHGLIDGPISSDLNPFKKLPMGEFELTDIAMLTGDGEISEEQGEELLARMEGNEFILLKKLKPGTKYADWTGSTWIRDEKHMLSDEQMQAIAQYKYHDLTQKLPKEPTETQYRILEDMLRVSIARAQGGEGLWNSEWEAEGIKPYRKRSDDDDDGETTTTTRTTVEKSTVRTTTIGGSLADKIRRKATTTIDTPKEEKTTEFASSTAEKTEPVASKASALAERIRAKANKK